MIQFAEEEAGLLHDGGGAGPVPTDGRLRGEAVGEGGEPPGHLPPPVVLLDDDHGPLLLPPDLELRDVTLVLPPLPVGADHDL